MAHDVFVSYSSRDKAVADAICARLESNGIRCWIAPRDVLPGAPYGEAIVDAIHGSRVMVLVLSSHANTSRHVPHEIERAVSHGVPVLPFRIEDVQPARALDYFIGSVHWLDALTPPLDRHLDALVLSVRKLLPEHRIEPPLPGPGPNPGPIPGPETPWRRMGLLAGVAIVGLAAWLVAGRLNSSSEAGAETTRPPAADSAGASLAGCWSWFNGATVTIRTDGTMVAPPFTAAWQHHGGRDYTFTWPEPVDSLTMSADGQRLTGSNQYGVPVTATRVSGGPSATGVWSWNGVANVTLEPRGGVQMGHLTGTWSATNGALRTYRVTWPKIQDTVAVSEDGSRIQGSNQYGVAVSGTKLPAC